MSDRKEAWKIFKQSWRAFWLSVWYMMIILPPSRQELRQLRDAGLVWLRDRRTRLVARALNGHSPASVALSAGFGFLAGANIIATICAGAIYATA